MNYTIKVVTTDKYVPSDGEPCALAWGSEGWTILCRTPIETATLTPRAASLAKAREAKRLKRTKNG